MCRAKRSGIGKLIFLVVQARKGKRRATGNLCDVVATILDSVRAVWPARLPLTMRLGADDFSENGVRFDDAILSNRIQLRPPLASKNDPTSVWCNGAEIGGAEPPIAEQSRSWRAAVGERKVMRGS